ncbi:MAG: cyclic nucleotide-binding domain-containing protein [Chloroflexi bacterium]|nr:cyclic nucleotide-binding domain-containing protein [Chloroflexota bacterium]
MTEPSAPGAEHAPNRPAFRAHPTHRILPDDLRLRALSLLEGIPLFREVPAHHLRELARFARSESFSAGEVIVKMGDPGSTLYIVRSGMVSVVREQPGGGEMPLAKLGPGEFFGELSIFDGHTRSATVTAVEETATVTLGRYDLVRLVSGNPQIALSLLKSLSIRLRDTDDRLARTEAVHPAV